MKKYLYYLFITISMGLVSCGGDDDNNPIDEPKLPTINVDKSIIDIWNFTEYHEFTSYLIDVKKEKSSGTFQVNQDGTFIMKGDVIGFFFWNAKGELPSEVHGTYSLLNSEDLYLKIDYNEYNIVKNYGDSYDVSIYYNKSKILEMDLHIKSGLTGNHIHWCFEKK